MSNENFIIKIFDGQEINFIERDNKPWITSRAIADGLGIDRTNVLQIYHNNKELLDPYTCVMKIISQGQNRDVRIFDKVGFIGVCMRSNSPRALPFQQWTLRVIDEIEKKGYFIANDRDLIDILKNVVLEQKEQWIILERTIKDFNLLRSQLNTIKEDKFDYILTKLESFHTAKELSEELDVSKKTVYKHLKTLQDENLIEVTSIDKSKKRGRPARKYKRISYIS